MRRVVIFLAVAGLVLAAAIGAGRLAFPLPDISNRAESRHLPANPETPLGRMMARGLEAHPGQTGIVPLQDGHDALASRLALIDAAERSIDAQYYIWHDDTSGILLLDALARAARRGVRVRLLLDDNGVHGLDGHMAALNARGNFEIRLFNPSTVRFPKSLGYAVDFFRMNRRMHNKSLIVDGAAAIIGGRNIGDEYFRVGDELFYVDMDVFATGRVVPETARMFDEYWNSRSVFAVERIIDGEGDPSAFEARVAEVRGSEEAETLRGDLQSSFRRFAEEEVRPTWTRVELVADDPSKGLGEASRDELMITRLAAILGGIERRMDLVSAYFVPGRAGTERFADLEAEGVEVRILTNAYDTTDVALVHSGYAKYRRELLEAGAELFELKLRGEMAAGAEADGLGLSGASLHAKTFAVDGARIFIGSFNFDPRSAMLNCEMGFLIESPDLAGRVMRGFEGPLAEVSYRPVLTKAGEVVWRERRGGGEAVTHEREPGASRLDGLLFALLGALPIEWLL